MALGAKLLLVAGLVIVSALPALAQSPQPFTIQKAQAIRISPDGQVSVIQMDMSAGMQSEMRKRARSMPNGLVVFLGNNGKAEYLTNPVNK